MKKINDQHNGFTLLEVLLALALFSLTIYAIYSSTFTTTQSLRATRYYQQAVLLADNMNQYLLSHHHNPSLYESKWQAQIQVSLPQAFGSLLILPSQTQIKIIWGGMTASQCLQSTSGLKGCLITTNYHFA